MDASYVRKPVSEWETATIREWMYAIEMRSDSVISEADYTGDWSDFEDDERMHAEFSAELKARGEKR
jgi:hypothetical protein